MFAPPEHSNNCAILAHSPPVNGALTHWPPQKASTRQSICLSARHFRRPKINIVGESNKRTSGFLTISARAAAAELLPAHGAVASAPLAGEPKSSARIVGRVRPGSADAILIIRRDENFASALAGSPLWISCAADAIWLLRGPHKGRSRGRRYQCARRCKYRPASRPLGPAGWTHLQAPAARCSGGARAPADELFIGALVRRPILLQLARPLPSAPTGSHWLLRNNNSQYRQVCVCVHLAGRLFATDILQPADIGSGGRERPLRPLAAKCTTTTSTNKLVSNNEIQSLGCHFY